MHVALNAAGSPQLGLERALMSMGEYLQIDWMEEERKGGREHVNEHIAFAAGAFSPDLTFCQIQNPGVLERNTLDRIPGIKINWSGDVRRETEQWYVDMAPYFHLTLFSNYRDVATLVAAGLPSAYLQIGFDEQVFTPRGQSNPEIWPEIVFMGGNYPDHFPLSEYRQEMVEVLKYVYGLGRFGVYGSNWAPHIRSLNQAEEAECYRSSKVAINLSHFSLPGYSSDRLFRLMGSGAFCLSQYYPGIEREFTPDEHLVTWRELPELCDKIDYYLEHEHKREAIARQGCAWAHQTCTWQARIDLQLKPLLEELE